MSDRTFFRLEGQFVGFEAGGKSPFKYLRLRTASGAQRIKLSKDLQLMLFRYLAAGDRLRVVGQQKIDKQTGEPRYKAQDVVRIDSGTVAALDPDAAISSVDEPGARHPENSKKKKARILICNKSSCRKRGSEAVCGAIAQTLSQLDLTDVELKKTGCIDRCKAGPNVVMMPGKAKYTRVSPNQIPKLVQQHYSAKAIADPS